MDTTTFSSATPVEQSKIHPNWFEWWVTKKTHEPLSTQQLFCFFERAQRFLTQCLFQIVQICFNLTIFHIIFILLKTRQKNTIYNWLHRLSVLSYIFCRRSLGSAIKTTWKSLPNKNASDASTDKHRYWYFYTVDFDWRYRLFYKLVWTIEIPSLETVWSALKTDLEHLNYAVKTFWLESISW